MARTRQAITIDEKIKKAEANVDRAKAKYDAAEAELKVLLDKKESLKKEEMLSAIMSSDKSYDEILAFLAQE